MARVNSINTIYSKTEKEIDKMLNYNEFLLKELKKNDRNQDIDTEIDSGLSQANSAKTAISSSTIVTESRTSLATSAALTRVSTAETTLAQMRPDEGLSLPTDLSNAVFKAVSDGINQIPAPAKAILNAIKNTPPDAIVAGTVITLPNGLKAGVFLLQPGLASNPLIPDLSKPPVVFISIPSKGFVATYNPANNQVEFGGGTVKPIIGSGLPKSPDLPGIKDTVFFYNVRDGGRVPGGNLDNAVSSTSGNFGFLNSTVSDPIAKWGIDALSKGVTQLARALEAAGVWADVVSGPSGEAVFGVVTVELFRHAVVAGIKKSTTWYVGVGWRGADVEIYKNGETNLNLSGGKVRLKNGEGTGGSGLSSDKFIVDLPNALGTLGGINRNQILSTNDPTAQRLGNILYSAYVESGTDENQALAFTRAAFKDGGKAQLAQRAREVLNATTPDVVTDRGFARRGMGEQSALLANEIYLRLRNSGYDPQEAWGAVWGNYIQGDNSGNNGLVRGGDSGGLNALKDLAYKVGIDPTPYLR